MTNLQQLKEDAMKNGYTEQDEEWRYIENAITDFVNPYPASCYRKLSIEKLCKFLLNLTN